MSLSSNIESIPFLLLCIFKIFDTYSLYLSSWWHNIITFQILTKDSVTVAVDAVIFTRIFDPVMATCNVANARYSTSLLAATTLRNVLGTKNMAELLSDRDTIADHMQVKSVYIFEKCTYNLFHETHASTFLWTKHVLDTFIFVNMSNVLKDKWVFLAIINPFRIYLTVPHDKTLYGIDGRWLCDVR